MIHDVVIIGGGAAGFFAALSAKEHAPESKVLILEKSQKLLAKVKISGGGRCNVTHACFDNRLLSTKYPRGQHFMRKAFSQFDAKSTVEWFEKRSISLRTYPDNCIFPASNCSQTIIDCFLKEAQLRNVGIQTGARVTKLTRNELFFVLELPDETIQARKIIIAIGGQPKMEGLEWIEKMGIKIVSPVPSLFTFNIPNAEISNLMGNVVENTTVKLEGSKLSGKGPLLVTHWGLSGPAVLQLSAYAARELADRNYQFSIRVNWLDEMREQDLRPLFQEAAIKFPEKLIGNIHPFSFSNRLWNYFLERSGVQRDQKWKQLGTKSLNKLVNTLLNDGYSISGKTTYKE
jgi:predicted Rossmann fold flavoprotein